MGCNCGKRRKAQITSANVATASQEPVSSEQVEALVAGAANTVTEREQPAGQARNR